MKTPELPEKIIANAGPDADVIVHDDARDDPKDRVLAGQIGRLLWEHYPGWAWYVEIPPNQNVVIIRNLDCDPRGRMGMVRYKNGLSASMHEVVLAAGEFLERYRMRRGRIDEAELMNRQMLFEKPDT